MLIVPGGVEILPKAQLRFFPAVEVQKVSLIRARLLIEPDFSFHNFAVRSDQSKNKLVGILQKRFRIKANGRTQILINHRLRL